MGSIMSGEQIGALHTDAGSANTHSKVPWRQLAFDEHRRTIEDRQAQCERLESALKEAVTEWRLYPVVEALQAMRGIQFITAVGLISELGDLTRFEHPRQLMSWFGITPSEYSSGGSRHQGSITKAGNSYARKLLVEAAWSYRHPARISPAIQKRQENLPRPVIDRAWDAQLRLCKRYRNFRPKERMSILQLLLLHVSWRVLSGIWAE
ncbi:transposase, IS110 family protein [Escherichia coli]|uniref:Transposase, IS110 family protein n=1 Tax=Escherichia coli TaxID=562 RepID=A0A376NUM8_ECOLX|nr:transposase, IS110 family protein [Escherichia coli]